MRVLNLTKANTRRGADTYTDSDDVGENRSVAAESPVVVMVDAIRCFYPRHAERGPGTRITFKDGGGFAVLEPFEVVKGMVEAAAD